MNQYKPAEFPECIRVSGLVSIFRRKLVDQHDTFGGESHGAWELLFLESGHLRVMVDGDLYTLSPGELILYPPHAFHTVSISSDSTVSVISFVTSSNTLYNLTGRLLVLSSEAQEDLQKIIVYGKSLIESYREGDVHGTAFRQEVPATDIQRLANQLELFLLGLCNSETRSNSKNFKDAQFAALTDYLKANMDKNFTLEDISDGCTISVAQLQKLCRKYCGCGPVTYFISLKIGAAKQMMKDSSLNITQIAERLGFSSVHYFSKLFKSKTGMSPSEFAKTGYKN